MACTENIRRTASRPEVTSEKFVESQTECEQDSESREANADRKCCKRDRALFVLTFKNLKKQIINLAFGSFLDMS